MSRRKPFSLKVSLARKRFATRIAINKLLLKLGLANTKCSLTLVAMVKNEIDILDAFILQALTLFDRVILLDHASTDRTNEYIAYVSALHPKVEYYALNMMGIYQSESMTWVAETLISTDEKGWVFMLDADEFLPCASREELEQMLAPFSAYPIISMPWINLIPASFEHEDLEAERLHMSAAVSHHIKVAFQPWQLRHYHYIITQGNHSIINSDTHKNFPAKHAFPLWHIPVRSKAHIVGKIDRLMQAYEIRKTTYVTHYSSMLALAKHHHFSDDVLAYVTAHYGEVVDEKTFDAPLPHRATLQGVAITVPFVNSRSALCQQYGIMPSATFNMPVPQTGRAIIFHPEDKRFTFAE